MLTDVLTGKHTALGGKHDTNEDRATYDKFEYEDEDYFFAGVFDGHGGHQCANYVASKLLKHLKQSYSKPNAWENGEDVMINIFHDIDREFCERAVRSRNYSGACATIVITKGDELIVGNIGDCRAVMVPVSKTGSYQAPVKLTEDHRAGCASENLRINAAGGKVRDGRVMTLEPSRSFGDIDVKLAAGKDVVIASPDVDKVFIHRGHKIPKKKLSMKSFVENRPFLIIATDGVWDVLKDKQAANIVKSTLKQFRSGAKSFGGLLKRKQSKTIISVSDNSSGSKPNEADICAEAIVRKAIAEGSDDDITVVVLFF